MDRNWYIDDDINGEQLIKFSSEEDDQKLKYMQKSPGGVTFWTHPVGHVYEGQGDLKISPRMPNCHTYD